MPTSATLICVDVGSTFTKAALVDGETGELLATADHATTIPDNGRGDVLDGIDACREELARHIPPRRTPRCLACSSAGGGLRIAVVGNEEFVTAEAGRRVALSSGGKVVAVLSGGWTRASSRSCCLLARTCCCWWAAPTVATPRASSRTQSSSRGCRGRALWWSQVTSRRRALSPPPSRPRRRRTSSPTTWSRRSVCSHPAPRGARSARCSSSTSSAESDDIGWLGPGCRGRTPDRVRTTSAPSVGPCSSPVATRPLGRPGGRAADLRRHTAREALVPPARRAWTPEAEQGWGGPPTNIHVPRRRPVARRRRNGDRRDDLASDARGDRQDRSRRRAGVAPSSAKLRARARRGPAHHTGRLCSDDRARDRRQLRRARDIVQHPPKLGDVAARTMTRTIRCGVVGDVRVQGGRAPDFARGIADGPGLRPRRDDAHAPALRQRTQRASPLFSSRSVHFQ